MTDREKKTGGSKNPGGSDVKRSRGSGGSSGGASVSERSAESRMGDDKSGVYDPKSTRE